MLLAANFPQIPVEIYALLLAVLTAISVRSRNVSLPLLAMAFGTAWMHWNAAAINSQILPDDLAGKDVQIIGYATGLPSSRPGSTRYSFRVLHILDGPGDMPAGLIRLSDYRPQHIAMQPGQAWRLVVRLKPSRGLANPGAFDYERWLFSQHIASTGYIRDDVRNRPVPALDVHKPVTDARQRIALAINELLGSSGYAGLVTALAVGDQRGIRPEQWEVLRQTGTAHLMAISGLHVGLTAWLAYMIGSLAWRSSPVLMRILPAQKAAMLVSLAAAMLYSLLAGFTLPTQRALIMLMTFSLAYLMDRNVRPVNILSLSLVLVLLLDPLAILSAGFWLSFGAVAMIFYGLMYRRADGRILAAVRMQLRLSLMLIPLTLLLFNQFSLISPVANGLAIPVVTFAVVPVVLLAVIVILLTGTHSVADGLLQAADFCLSLLWQLLAWLADIESAVDAWQPLMQPALALVLMIMLPLVLPVGLRLRRLAPLLLLFIVVPINDRLEQGEVRLMLLDVGQGLSVLVQTRDHALLFDSGARFSETFDAGSAVVVPVLRRMSIAELDSLLISHGDNDHIGGAESIMHSMNVKQVLSNELLPGYPALPCTEGREWRWNGVKFSILHPRPSQSEGSGNNTSCVMRIESPFGTILIPADIESEAENRLVADYGPDLKSDILVAPHHGSNTSSSRGFIEHVDPDIYLVSAGWRNRYRHPSDKVVQRVRDRGVQILSTAECGALDIVLHDTGRTLVAERGQQRLWRRRGTDCHFL
jgi:competence protein ComEC